MDVTVGIPTFNRSGYLRGVLEDLRQVHVPEGINYEIIVLDNGDDPSTPALIAELEPFLEGRLRYLREHRTGLGIARNRVLGAARGEVVAFLDDDVKVEPQWLAALVEAYRRWPDAAVVGGKAYLIFETPPPRWLGDSEERMLSRVDNGNRPLLCKPNEIYGLNLSMRRSIADEIGGFKEDLGRIGKKLLSGEELEFLRRVIEKGNAIYYDPAMLVGHRVPAERLTKGWFLRRRFWYGRTRVRMSCREKRPHRARIAAEMVYRAGRIAREVVRFALHLPNERARFRCVQGVCFHGGYLREMGSMLVRSGETAYTRG